MFKTTTAQIPKTLFAFFWHFIRQQWKWFLPLQLLCFAWALDHTLFPLIVGMLVDAITQYGGDRANVWHAVALPLLLGAGLWMSLEVGYRGAGFIAGKVYPNLEASVRMSMFDYVQRHSYSYFSNNLAGGLANRIAEMPHSMTHVVQLVTTLFAPVFLALIISTSFFALLSPVFALILITWIVVHLGICLACAKRCAFYSDVHAESRANLAGKIVDSFSAHLNVRLFGGHRYENEYLSRYQEKERTKHKQSLVFIEKVKIALSIPTFIGPVVILNWYMIYSWQQGTITTGDVIFIFNTSWNITMMVWLAGLEIPNLFKEAGICNQALSVIAHPHDIVDHPKAEPARIKRGEIVFENVTFDYAPSCTIFRNKNIAIPAGSKVGLVGFSGSGKTTFVHLIIRYFDVKEGRILIDGQNIATVTLDSLRSQISMIPQDTSLFHRSIIDNIRYGRLDATDEEVIIAAKQARCHEFIEKLPDKYNTTAGERGVKLSGGQRQRIAIARAFLKNAPILILDEATSALDSVTEKDIQDAMEQLMQGRTTIAIAHRLSTLSGMDRILVFKDGKIAEDGTHDELIGKDEGHYAKLWNMQAGGFLPDDYYDEE